MDSQNGFKCCWTIKKRAFFHNYRKRPDYLWRGRTSRWCYILSLGKVQLFKNTSDGKLAEKQTVNSMQVFGVWNSILGNNVRLFTAKALEKSSALIIPKATLDKKLSTNDPFLRLLFRQALSNSKNFGSLWLMLRYWVRF